MRGKVNILLKFPDISRKKKLHGSVQIISLSSNEMKHEQMGSSNQESGLVGLGVLIPLVEKVPEGVVLHHQAQPGELLVERL